MALDTEQERAAMLDRLNIRANVESRALNEIVSEALATDLDQKIYLRGMLATCRFCSCPDAIIQSNGRIWVDDGPCACIAYPGLRAVARGLETRHIPFCYATHAGDCTLSAQIGGAM